MIFLSPSYRASGMWIEIIIGFYFFAKEIVIPRERYVDWNPFGWCYFSLRGCHTARAVCGLKSPSLGIAVASACHTKRAVCGLKFWSKIEKNIEILSYRASGMWIEISYFGLLKLGINSHTARAVCGLKSGSCVIHAAITPSHTARAVCGLKLMIV